MTYEGNAANVVPNLPILVFVLGGFLQRVKRSPVLLQLDVRMPQVVPCLEVVLVQVKLSAEGLNGFWPVIIMRHRNVARQHKVAGVACYRLERALVGCFRPPSW